VTGDVQSFIESWKGNSAGENATAQQHFLALCDALKVPQPTPQEQQALTYRFEMPVEVLVRQGQRPSTERIDVYKKGHFIWENKQGSDEDSRRQGHGRRGSKSWQTAMRQAFRQARRYAVNLPSDAPPFLVICDVGHHIEIWNDFSGTGKHYSDRPSRLFAYDDLEDLKTQDYLRRVITDPGSLNPAAYQDEVTRQVAEKLADLAKGMEKSYSPTETSQFLMRCIFTMFAEDVELIPSQSFTALLGQFIDSPEQLTGHLTQLWDLMNTGGFLFGLGKIRQFNGGLFQNACPLLLTGPQVKLLHEAAEHDWSEVEPTIFGTLVERALDPVERHRLGAHFTPRPYIERIVRPTVIEPLRDDWLAVEAAVLDELGDDEPPPASATKKAVKLLTDFHRKLCQIRVLDPACGTGNFLYVTYDLLKDLEAEVQRRLEDLGEQQLGLQVAGETVTPTQMLGIEKNPRAREIADLVLWVGHLQRMLRDGTLAGIREPIIQESDHIECRDAVLAWDGDPVPRLDADGKVIQVWDMRTTRTDPITGREVPDENAMVSVFDYANTRPAQWPEADFVVSNPPFVGNKRMRRDLGEGYTEALREVWPEVPGSADFVMYWWERCAALVRLGEVRGFGLITTNSITQVFNRQVVDHHVSAEKSPLAIRWAIPDHPWVDRGAAVRIAMTVGVRGAKQFAGARLVLVTHEADADNAQQAQSRNVQVMQVNVDSVHADLTRGANVGSAVALEANKRLSFMGVTLIGKGFAISPEMVGKLGYDVNDLPSVIRPYLSGRDVTQNGGQRFAIDLTGFTAEEVRTTYPALYQWILNSVKPERDHNKDQGPRKRWWLFGRNRPDLREAVRDLKREIIITPETAKHRFFLLASSDLCPDHSLYVVALEDPWFMGVLSSRFHLVWALAAGATLESRPRWRNRTCFDPFPFPMVTDDLKQRIRTLAEGLDAHRRAVQVRHGRAHYTAQYNALGRVREANGGGKPLSDKERSFHDEALIGVLQSIHEELDAAVAEAYGWPADLSDQEILGRLVALNTERAAEEAQGMIRWLRPDFQAPTSGTLSVAKVAVTDKVPLGVPSSTTPWPKENKERLLAVRDALQGSDVPLSIEQLAAWFSGAVRKKTVLAAVSSLESLGLVSTNAEGCFTLDQ